MAAHFDRHTLRMLLGDHARWILLVAAAGLVPIGLGAVLLVREAASESQKTQDARLRTAASGEVAGLTQSFARARALLEVTAASPVWRAMLADRTHPFGANAGVQRRVEDALVALRHGYGGRLAGTAQAIDGTGHVVAVAHPSTWVSRGRPGDDQTLNRFFWASTTLPQGTVYQSAPYVAEDTHEWVVSSSTAAMTGPGDRVILQLQVPVGSLRREALLRARGAEMSVVDARTGLVVFSSEPGRRVATPLAGRGLRAVRTVTRTGRPAGLVDVDGRRVAYVHLNPSSANANDWYVVAAAPYPHTLRPTAPAQVVVLLMALGLGGLGLALSRQSRAIRKEAERSARRLTYDDLTGLPNRVLLRDRTERAIAAAKREGVATAVLLMDIDGFREINDTLGHHSGDRVIAAVAARLRGVLRTSDTLARLGGDEFAILMPRIMEASAAVELARRVRTALAASLVLHGVPLDIRASIGIAAYPDHGDDVDSILQHADTAMYVAKDTRTTMQVYDPSTDEHSTARLALAGELRHAIDGGEIVVHYQPKASLADGRVAGVEALVRWQHPKRGMIAPNEFVHLAEHTGLIRPLTRQVLRLALAQCSEWRHRGIDLAVAVNLSMRDLVDADLPGSVAAELDRFGVEASSLRIEITETMLVLDPGRTIDVLNRLHEMGVRISLDDFGTGYSSLSYLQRLPVDELKIDRSFVSRLTGSETDTRIVEATVALARQLGLTTVAEGVERADTWERLARLGCDVAQGYLISRPLPADELEAWLAAGAGRHAATSDHADGV